MRYEYEDNKGNKVERTFSMKEDIPKEIEEEGVIYTRVWSMPLFNISTRGDNYLHKDMDDFSRCSISKGSVTVDSPRCGKVQAQLRVDGNGKPEMVYKSNPTRVVDGSPSKAVIDKLGGKMESYLHG